MRSIETAPDAAAIVHAVVSLGRGLGMRVTAEGVENAEQHLFLRAAGVHSMQGYRFGRPGPAADITARLAIARRLPRRQSRPGNRAGELTLSSFRAARSAEPGIHNHRHRNPLAPRFRNSRSVVMDSG